MNMIKRDDSDGGMTELEGCHMVSKPWPVASQRAPNGLGRHYAARLLVGLETTYMKVNRFKNNEVQRRYVLWIE